MLPVLAMTLPALATTLLVPTAVWAPVQASMATPWQRQACQTPLGPKSVAAAAAAGVQQQTRVSGAAERREPWSV